MSDIAIRNAKGKGKGKGYQYKLADERGLYLSGTPKGRKYWREEKLVAQLAAETAFEAVARESPKARWASASP